MRPACAIALLASLGGAAAHARVPRPDFVFAHQFEDGVATLAPNLTAVRVDSDNATTHPTPLTLTLTAPAASDTFVPLATSEPLRLQVTGGGVTVPSGQSSVPVRVDALAVGAQPVQVSAGFGNFTAAGVRVETAVNETDLPVEADYCNLQFPTGFSVQAGQSTPPLFGRVFEAGSTATAGPPAGVVSQAGYGPDGTDPRDLAGWQFVDATYNVQVLNDDEFQASVVAPLAVGTYRIAYRFALDGGGSWTYCDVDGAGSNGGLAFAPSALGTMTVTAPDFALVINEIDYDQPGTDTSEFVELYNAGPDPLDLSAFALVLVNGADNAEYVRYALQDAGAQLAAGQYLVVRHATVAVPMGTPTIVLTMDAVVQNGSPDAVALVHLPTRTIVDAFSYEGSVTAAQIGGFPGTVNLVEGTPATAADGGVGAQSLIRQPNGADTDNANGDWSLSITPTPGTPNQAM